MSSSMMRSIVPSAMLWFLLGFLRIRARLAQPFMGEQFVNSKLGVIYRRSFGRMVEAVPSQDWKVTSQGRDEAAPSAAYPLWMD
jgi:hypothetical protein